VSYRVQNIAKRTDNLENNVCHAEEEHKVKILVDTLSVFTYRCIWGDGNKKNGFKILNIDKTYGLECFLKHR
jgi:hypothetical protein